MTFDLAARFLCHHGTIISGQRKFMLPKDDLLRCYFNMVLGTKIISQGGPGISEKFARTNITVTHTDNSSWAQTLTDCNMIA